MIHIILTLIVIMSFSMAFFDKDIDLSQERITEILNTPTLDILESSYGDTIIYYGWSDRNKKYMSQLGKIVEKGNRYGKTRYAYMVVKFAEDHHMMLFYERKSQDYVGASTCFPDKGQYLAVEEPNNAFKKSRGGYEFKSGIRIVRIGKESYAARANEIKEKQANFEKLYKKVVGEYKPEPVKMESVDSSKIEDAIELQSKDISTTIHHKKLDEKIKQLRKLCSNNDSLACNSLGVKYATGVAIEKNTKKANELYLKACNNGIVSGCFNLGISYLNEFGINYNRKLAKKYFNKACKKGHKKGCKWYKIASTSKGASEREILDLKKLKEATVPNDATITFWNDYGESISKISETLVLGNENNHHESDYAISKILLSSSPKEVKDLMKSSVLKYINTEKKINDVYLYFPYRLMNDFSSSKLTTLASERMIELYATNASDNTNEIITFRNKMVFDTKKGVVNFGDREEDVKYFIATQNTKDNRIKLQSQLYSADGKYVVVYMKSYGRFVIMDSETFNSTYVQMFILGKYDRDLFELVVSSSHSRIYKLKK